MSVLRRLYNVAYGRVQIWRKDESPDDSLDAELLRPSPDLRASEPRPSERVTEPLGETPPPTEPRQRRL